ncbi:Radical SAM superfamily protein [Thalassoglobus neptunius]|uniref:Radical SAM superfamily protein n=1 Tax=Thalassoglobus neptunius TaxID=1938619 RepID=A0A5C5X156_9PLAN|nr:radical SAM protein [Thalassoglobus neptunius]TWT56686.1 Radical SAM superfamily protein [Thalassoglobus neptunius]
MTNSPSVRQHRSHPRQYEQNRFVYPVLSRRSKGISIGVNLNPDKVCNFDCIYCQVDRRSESVTQFVEFEQLFDELAGMLEFVSSGEIFTDPRFADVPSEFQRLNDIAFSGDGEPTTYRNFDEIIERAAQLKASLGLDAVKMVLITNASMFHRPVVQRGLKLLDENQGEIWAKLDAGTSEYFQLVDRTKIRFQQVLDNILDASRVRPLVIQSLFMRVHGEPPTSEEIEAYIDRLKDVLESGGQLSLVQVYTVARQPAESFVAPLLNEEVDAIAERVRTRTGLAVESYYS